MSDDLKHGWLSTELQKKCLLNIFKKFENGIFYTKEIFKKWEVEF